ncbi:hypothetical protein [Mycobacterium sp.]|uniref:hypothetical protein n=1 Tax=Mycobacterium sp. TaxID=1785 RepID=UPI003D6B3C15
MMDKAVVHPSSAVADAWEAAYKESVVTPPWEQARHLIGSVGVRYTTAALGLKDARTVRGWVERQAEPREHDVVSRLAVLFRAVRAIESIYTPTVAAAFLRSSNPQLDDEAPLVVLSTQPVGEAEQAVLVAARAFLKG